VRKTRSRSFKLSAKLDDLLCTKARELGITASECIRYALISWLCNTQGNTPALPNQIHHQPSCTHTDDVHAYVKHDDPEPEGPDLSFEEGTQPQIEIPNVGGMEEYLDNPWASILSTKGGRKKG